MTWWLEAGEDGSDRLDLMAGASGAPGYSVLSQGFDIVPDAEDPDRFQILSIPLLIKGSSKNDLFNKRRAILTKLNQASFNRQPGSGQPRVTIAIRFGDADTLVRWVIESGNLTRGNLSAITSNTLGSMEEPAILQLRCWRGGLGERIDYGPFTVSGADPTLHINGVPGDLPGVLEMHVEDTSTNSVAVNRLIWACRSLPDMADGDFNPVLPFNEADESEPDTFTGGIASISATQTWQTIGSVSRAASAHDGGVFDVYARLRDAATPLTAPSLNRATVIPGPLPVQNVSASFTSANNPVMNFSQETQNGSTLVMALGRRDGNADYTPPTGWIPMLDVGTGPSLRVFYYPDAPPHTSTGEFVKSVSHTAQAAALEIIGVTATPLDRTATDTTSSATSHPTGTTATTQQQHELLLGFIQLFSVSLFTIDGSWDIDLTHDNTLAIASQLVNAAATYSGTFTTSGSTNSAAGIATLRAVASTPPDLEAGTYSFWVTTLDGSIESAASLSLETTIVTPSAVYLQWSQSGFGTPTGYRVYWKKDADAIVYVDTGSTDTSFTLSTDTSDGTADPPLTPVDASQFRAFIGRENSATQQPAIGPFTANVANSEWEWVYLRRVHLPPSSTPGVADMTDWTLVLQGRADTSTQLDADAILLLPADENSTVDACYPPKNLTTPHEWHVWSTPQGVPGGYLTDGTDEAGSLRVRGMPSIGPGDTTMTFVPSVAGGISNVEDVEFDVQVYVWPRYEWLAGES